MTNDAIVALVSSLVGGILVAIVNYLLVRKKMLAEIEKIKVETERVKFEKELEINKLRQEFEQVYINKLLEKRLEVYPGLYAILSTFTKNVRNSEEVSKSDVKDLFGKISDWNAKNQIYLGAFSSELEFRFRRKLLNLLKKNETAFTEEFTSVDSKKELIRSADIVKNALKDDIGIYLIENPEVEIPRKLKQLRSFKEIGMLFDRGLEA